MQSDRPGSTRRQVLKTVVVAACCPAFAKDAASAVNGKTVDQITDVKATAATDMFRFSPDFVTLAPGEQLTFLNSRSNHTVHSVPELWPSGVPAIGIAHKPEAVVHFEREGFYGFRCRRHGQYGMVMLVIVGQPDDTAPFRASIEGMRAKARERSGFLRLLEQYERA